jgi:putative ABC transport system ATP-binding protein
MASVSVQGVEQLFHLGKRNVVHALRGTDLEVSDGEFVAVMGPSGSGKTSLLNVIGCLARPTAGHVLLDGRDVGKMRASELDGIRAREVGFVFQGHSLIPTRTALENVILAADYARVPRAERRTRAIKILERVGLEERVDARASELSGGERQRVAIARALVKEPTLVLADEPTGNLDSVSAEEIVLLMKEMRSAGQAVVMVTHDPKVAGYADRVVLLRDGRVVGDETIRPS